MGLKSSLGWRKRRAGCHSGERGELADEVVGKKAGGKGPALGRRCGEPSSLWATHTRGAERGGRCTIGKLCSTEGLRAGRVDGAEIQLGPPCASASRRGIVPWSPQTCLHVLEQDLWPRARGGRGEGRDVSAGATESPCVIVSKSLTRAGPHAPRLQKGGSEGLLPKVPFHSGIL